MNKENFEMIELDKNHSTTRRVIKADPQEIAGLVKQANKPEDTFETVLFLPEGEGRQGEGGLRTQGYFKTGGIIPSPETKPLITVVTVVFSGEKFLEETILSVINQTYDNVEYIIIDGGSTDGTLDIIKKYEHAIDYWVSEKDKGIYDAMNKGIDLATGEWINFMNAGDFFSERKTIEKIPFMENDSSVLIYGNKIQDGKVIYPLSIKQLVFGEIMACHQSMFFNLNVRYRHKVFYDLSYKIYGDYELVNRLYIHFRSFKYIDQPISTFQGGGVSSRVSTQKRKDKYRAVLSQYGVVGLVKSLIYRLMK